MTEESTAEAIAMKRASVKPADSTVESAAVEAVDGTATESITVESANATVESTNGTTTGTAAVKSTATMKATTTAMAAAPSLCF